MIDSKGVALVTVLAFILVLTIISGVHLGLMTNQARIAEHQIRRIKAYYSCWAGLVHNLERLRQGQEIENLPDPNFPGRNIQVTSGPQADQINSQVDYLP